LQVNQQADCSADEKATSTETWLGLGAVE